MKVNVEELSSVQRKIVVELPAAEVDKTLNQLYNKLKRTAKLKGFRPGKAPRPILERYYGDQVTMEAAENLLQESYPGALGEVALDPVAQPSFDFQPPEAGKDFVYEVVFDVAPKFDLDAEAYKGFELKEPRLEMTEEQMAQRLNELRDRQALLVPVEEDREAAIGDVLVVDYQSFEGEKPVEGGQAENVDIELGGGKVREEIEVALVKAKPGDVVETTVHYDARPGEAGSKERDVRFVIQVKGLKKKVLPELDDDFARGVGPEFASLEDLKARIAKDMDEYYQQQRDDALRKQILDKVRELGEFDVPQSLVSSEMDDMLESFKAQMRQNGFDVDASGLDQQKLREGYRDQAEKKVRAGIVLGKIADLENVEIGEDDLQGEYDRVAARTGQAADIVKDIYIKNNMLPNLTARLMEEKTLQAIKAGATIIQVEPSELAEKNEPAPPAENPEEEQS